MQRGFWSWNERPSTAWLLVDNSLVFLVVSKKGFILLSQRKAVFPNELIMILSVLFWMHPFLPTFVNQRPSTPPSNGSMVCVVYSDGIRASTSLGEETADSLQPVPVPELATLDPKTVRSPVFGYFCNSPFSTSHIAFSLISADAAKTRGCCGCPIYDIRNRWRAAVEKVGSEDLCGVPSCPTTSHLPHSLFLPKITVRCTERVYIQWDV